MIRPCGQKAAWPIFILLFLFFLLPSYARADYADELTEKAVSRKLYEKREWLVLLHYKHTIFHGHQSLIDSPRFFLSPEGKNDPRKEMEETIRSFFKTDISGDAHAVCKYPARLDFLKRELGIDPERLPKEECREYDELIRGVKPESAVLIFPVSHMNSPASMFGHTLLRIDSDSESKLLSYAVNYSATSRETNGILFAFKGIFGMYEGYFSILPYYEKIKEYNALENRDMWEYKLNLTKEEVMRAVNHMWELKDIYSYYYFFDENCSYNLLLVLEAARPDKPLSEDLPGWVIPMDTIRVVDREGLYSKDISYRPAKATKIKYMETITDADCQALAKNIAEERIAPEAALEGDASKEYKIKSLDLAAEYLQYRYAKKKIGKEEYQRLYLKVLAARSTLGKAPPYEIPKPASPEEGHGPARLTLGGGVVEGASYLSVKLRPANHDLMDPDTGYLQGAAITFMDGEARYDLTENKFSLERLTLLEIISASEIDRFFQPISWTVKTGLEREEFAKREHRTVYQISGGPGAAYDLKGGLLYAFIEPELKLGGDLNDKYALGGGLVAGFLKPVTDSWKAQLQLTCKRFELGEKHTVYSAELNQRYTIDRNNALRVNFKRERFGGFYSSDINFGWDHYF